MQSGFNTIFSSIDHHKNNSVWTIRIIYTGYSLIASDIKAFLQYCQWLSILRNYFHDTTKLFSDLQLTKFWNVSAKKSFFPYNDILSVYIIYISQIYLLLFWNIFCIFYILNGYAMHKKIVMRRQTDGDYFRLRRKRKPSSVNRGGTSLLGALLSEFSQHCHCHNATTVCVP